MHSWGINMRQYPRLTLPRLAEYMTASESSKRKLLMEHKYPDTADVKRMQRFYQEAKLKIAAYHRNRHTADWLVSQAVMYEQRVPVEIRENERRRLQGTADVLHAYAANFANRQFGMRDPVALTLCFRGVTITVRPDLHVVERKREKFIVLGCQKPALAGDAGNVIAQGVLQAIQTANPQAAYTSSSAAYLDIRRGTEFRGRIRSRVARDIEAACATIADVWPHIEDEL
jgi:hypothetical protein